MRWDCGLERVRSWGIGGRMGCGRGMEGVDVAIDICLVVLWGLCLVANVTTM